MTWDVAVIGCSIAGCAAALALQGQGLHTLVMERRRTLPLRVGEHIPPNVQPLLKRLGTANPLYHGGHQSCPGIEIAWGRAARTEREYIVSPFGSGWNLDRAAFDAHLVAAATEAGADLRWGARLTELTRTADGWSLTVDDAAGRHEYRVRFLVDASGRASAVARKLGARRLVADRQQALVGRLVAEGVADTQRATLLIEAAEQGWWYATPLSRGRMVAAFLTDPPLANRHQPSLARRWDQVLMQTHHMQARLRGYAVDQLCAYPANSYCLDRVAGHGWMAVGDAAMAFDPLSSQGIGKALHTGMAAAEVIPAYLAGDAQGLRIYASAAVDTYQRYLATRHSHYARQQRWRQQPYWQRRHRLDAPMPAMPETLMSLA